jgi:hypothetical protein
MTTSPFPELPQSTTAAVVRPGDTLVIAMNARLTPESAAQIEQGAKAAMPGLAEVVVISDAAGLAVYRAGLEHGPIEMAHEELDESVEVTG